MRSTVEANPSILIRRIYIDAIKNHILGRGGGDSNINSSLENYVLAIKRGDLDGCTPRGARGKFCSYTVTAIQELRIGSSAHIEGIAGLEQTDRMVEGAEGRGLRP